jgi:hypothetical protein
VCSDDDRRNRSDDRFDEEEQVTLIPCVACGGDFRRVVECADGTYGTEVCRHCTQGAMSDAQLQKWKVARTPVPPA